MCEARCKYANTQPYYLLQDIEQAIYLWLLECENRNIPLNWRAITMAGSRFAQRLGYPEGTFKASNGWQDRFRRRFDLAQIHLHGESASADTTARMHQIPLIIDKVRKYNPCDVYNMDETALLYCNLLTTTIGTRRIHGMKQDKSRITIALTVNANGSDFRELLIIGKSANPTCFGKNKSGI